MGLQAQEKERILFVGNSFTFYWNLPSQVEQMAKERGLLWDVEQTTASGASLRDHWQGNKALTTKQLLEKKLLIGLFFKTTVPILWSISIPRLFILKNSKPCFQPKQKCICIPPGCTQGLMEKKTTRIAQIQLKRI